MKSIFNIILWVLLLGITISILSIFKWWFPWMSFEVPWKHLTETYLEVWDYKIWKQKFQYNICHNKKWCLDGKILWFEIINDIWYALFDINYGSWKTIYKSWEIKYYYSYVIYKNSKYSIKDTVVNKITDLPKFSLLRDNKLEFYSENDLEKLSEIERQIFEDLEKKPSIIIEWINYSK